MPRVSGTNPTPRPNDDVLMVGMNEGASHEAAALRKRGTSVTLVRDSALGDDQIAVTGADRRRTVYDLNSSAGVDNFVATLGLPAEQSTQVADAIRSTGRDSRDELAQLAQVWAQGEKGGKVPSRVILSGHSVGSGVWGDNNGSLGFDSIGKLAAAMPKAASQVEDVHIAACYAGTGDNADRFKGMFPNMKTFFAYDGSAPGSHSGATAHQARWDAATRGRKDDLDRGIVAGTRKGENAVTWTEDGGFKDGQPPRPLSEVRGAVQRRETDYQRFLEGSSTVSNPQTGPLRDYYNDLQRLLQHPNLPSADRPGLEARRDQAIRLLYYSQNVAPKFQAEHQAAIRDGYSAAGLTAPDFSRLSRADALAQVQAFDQKLSELGTVPPAAARLQALLHSGVRDLDRSTVPDGWI